MHMPDVVTIDTIAFQIVMGMRGGVNPPPRIVNILNTYM